MARRARPKVGVVWMTWRQAMQAALYGPGGFYARGEPPARHFRTSVHVSPGYAGAVLELLRQVDAALGRPERIDLVEQRSEEHTSELHSHLNLLCPLLLAKTNTHHYLPLH